MSDIYKTRIEVSAPREVFIDLHVYPEDKLLGQYGLDKLAAKHCEALRESCQRMGGCAVTGSAVINDESATFTFECPYNSDTLTSGCVVETYKWQDEDKVIEDITLTQEAVALKEIQ